MSVKNKTENHESNTKITAQNVESSRRALYESWVLRGFFVFVLSVRPSVCNGHKKTVCSAYTNLSDRIGISAVKA